MEENIVRRKKRNNRGRSREKREGRFVGSLKEHKVGCYEMKLKRNKWLGVRTQYSSEDFKKLGLDLPELSRMSRTQFITPELGTLNIKPTIQPIL